MIALIRRENFFLSACTLGLETSISALRLGTEAWLMGLVSGHTCGAELAFA
jgi:hypothetical protein